MDTTANHTLVIEAGKVERQYWSDLWRFRELFYFLAWRDVLVRYKQTAIGVAWSVIRPVLTMLVFTSVFGRIAKLPSGGAPYPILVFAGTIPWQFFANGLTEASNSLIANSNMVSKIYFPRIVVPSSAVIASLVDLAITVVILFVLMAFYRFPVHSTIVWMPAFVLLAVLATIGPSLLLSALNVKYRDFRYIVPFIVQFGLFISPVGFSTHLIPQRWKLLFSLNPMVSVIDGFRYCILGEQIAPLTFAAFAPSAAMVALLLWAGVAYFRKTERSFADLI